MKLFKSIAIKLGYSETEVKVILFVISVMIIGGIIKLFNTNIESMNEIYNYTESDSIFYSIVNENLIDSNKNNFTSDVVNNQESLDFSQGNLKSPKKEIELKPKSINLNKASVQELSLLPGVGMKTAEAIVKYRQENKGFKSINEVMNIKGIGQAKFNKMKEFLTVE